MICVVGMQLAVAGYALRLNMLFGTARVGWSLFCAFAMLALLQLIQSANALMGDAQFNVQIEVVYVLISFLLLTGLLHMEALLKERLRMEQVEKQLRAELESQVKKKAAHLIRAIEELVSEIDERKKVQALLEEAQKDLVASLRLPNRPG